MSHDRNTYNQAEGPAYNPVDRRSATSISNHLRSSLSFSICIRRAGPFAKSFGEVRGLFHRRIFSAVLMRII